MPQKNELRETLPKLLSTPNLTLYEIRARLATEHGITRSYRRLDAAVKNLNYKTNPNDPVRQKILEIRKTQPNITPSEVHAQLEKEEIATTPDYTAFVARKLGLKNFMGSPTPKTATTTEPPTKPKHQLRNAIAEIARTPNLTRAQIHYRLITEHALSPATKTVNNAIANLTSRGYQLNPIDNTEETLRHMHAANPNLTPEQAHQKLSTHKTPANPEYTEFAGWRIGLKNFNPPQPRTKTPNETQQKPNQGPNQINFPTTTHRYVTTSRTEIRKELQQILKTFINTNARIQGTETKIVRHLHEQATIEARRAANEYAPKTHPVSLYEYLAHRSETRTDFWDLVQNHFKAPYNKLEH